MTAAVALAPSGLTLADWQPIYERLGIVIFPVGPGKRPLVQGWQAATMRHSRAWARRMGCETAFGFCPGRHGVVVGDIDTPDEAYRDQKLEQWGRPRVLVRTASGKWHAYYRGEAGQDRIRPMGPDEPFDVKCSAEGMVIAPGSVTAAGTYDFVWGDVDGLSALTPSAGLLPPAYRPSTIGPHSVEPAANDRPTMREGVRNRALFRHLGTEARYADSLEQLIDKGLQFAQENFVDAMAEAEVRRVAESVWRYQTEGRNFIGRSSSEGRKVILESDAIDDLVARAGIEGAGLYAVLRKRHPGSQPFTIANSAANDDDLRCSRRQLVSGRNALLALGVIEQVRPPSSGGGPGLFRWRDRS